MRVSYIYRSYISNNLPISYWLLTLTNYEGQIHKWIKSTKLSYPHIAALLAFSPRIANRHPAFVYFCGTLRPFSPCRGKACRLVKTLILERKSTGYVIHSQAETWSIWNWVWHCNNTWGRRVRIGMSPRLIPTQEVRKNPICMSTDESIGITFAVWAIIPLLYEDTPWDVLSIR